MLCFIPCIITAIFDEGSLNVILSELSSLLSTEFYDPCELCRHCPSYDSDPSSVGYTQLGSSLSNCTICDQALCRDTDITQYTKNEGMTDFHVDVMEISNVVCL